ncbi:unnamed protein product, partial [Amoebophrya sp. A25]
GQPTLSLPIESHRSDADEINAKRRRASSEFQDGTEGGRVDINKVDYSLFTNPFFKKLKQQ